MEICERIKKRRKELGMSAETVADRLGVSPATIYRYEKKDIKKFPSDILEPLAEVLHTTPMYLLGIEENSENKNKYLVPVLGTVRAGLPIEAVETIIDYEEISEDMAKQGEFFALQIKGDSMEPRICEGDVVIVRKQSDVDSGDTAIVLVGGEEATIKKIQKFDGGINLVPGNPSYNVRTYTNEQIESLPVQILGKVVELRGKFA